MSFRFFLTVILPELGLFAMLFAIWLWRASWVAKDSPAVRKTVLMLNAALCLTALAIAGIPLLSMMGKPAPAPVVALQAFDSNASLGHLLIAFEPNASESGKEGGGDIHLGYISRGAFPTTWIGFRRSEFRPNDYPSRRAQIYVMPIIREDQTKAIEQIFFCPATTQNKWSFSDTPGNGSTAGTNVQYAFKVLADTHVIDLKDDANLSEWQSRLSRSSELEAFLLSHGVDPAESVISHEVPVSSSPDLKDDLREKRLEAWRVMRDSWSRE